MLGGHEIHVRQEITPKRVALGLTGAAAIGIAAEVVHHFHQPSPDRRELHRHLQAYDNRPTEILLMNPEFAGA